MKPTARDEAISVIVYAAMRDIGYPDAIARKASDLTLIAGLLADDFAEDGITDIIELARQLTDDRATSIRIDRIASLAQTGETP